LSEHELSYRKNVLSIAARRAIRQAVLVAENAARGRFPTDKWFPEAILSPYSRKAGRPPNGSDSSGTVPPRHDYFQWPIMKNKIK